MTRGLTPTQTTTVEAQQAHRIHLFEFLFGNGTSDAVRYSTSSGDFAWNALTWLGTGGTLSFEAIENTSDLRAQGAVLVLAGVSPAIISTLLTMDYRGRYAKIWRAYFDPAVGTIIDTPIPLGAFLMNGSFEVEEQKDEQTGVIYVEVRARVVSRLAMFRQRRGILSNVASHQRITAGDTFWQNVPALIGKPIPWGVPATRATGR